MHCDTNRTQLQSDSGIRRARLASLFYPGGLLYRMPPLSSLRRRRHPVFFMVLCTLLCSVACSRTPMIVDGEFDDWHGSTDHVMVDGSMLWIDLHIDGPPSNLQQLDEPLQLQLHLDDGAQRKFELTFSPEPDNMGVELTRIYTSGRREAMSPYELDVMFAPTVAANRFELVVDLQPLLTGAANVRVLGLPTQQSTDVVVHPQAVLPAETIPQRDDSSLRIVSWNVQFGTLLKKRDRAAAVLRALDPDVLLLQELEDEQTPAELRDMLDEALGPGAGAWNITASPAGSGLRSMTAARFATPHDGMEFTAPFTADGKPVRASMLALQWAGRPWLACSVHLQCCGGIGGPQDALRIDQSHSINDAIDHAGERTSYAGVIIGGDLNLVGSSIPLHILTNGRDPMNNETDGAARVAGGAQLDGLSATTWSDLDSRFTPGRLDWIIYSGSSLQETRSFVLDCEDLSRADLDRHDLRRTDTASISDHLPVVLDVSVK